MHGIDVRKNNAKDILEIASSLNKSFSLGYCINFEPNKEYRKNGLLCPYEHHIEFMNLSKKTTKKSCPIFGHDCPNWKEYIKKCSKKKKTLWEEITWRMQKNAENG